MATESITNSTDLHPQDALNYIRSLDQTSKRELARAVDIVSAPRQPAPEDAPAELVRAAQVVSAALDVLDASKAA